MPKYFSSYKRKPKIIAAVQVYLEKYGKKKKNILLQSQYKMNKKNCKVEAMGCGFREYENKQLLGSKMKAYLAHHCENTQVVFSAKEGRLGSLHFGLSDLQLPWGPPF